nr:MAG TPA: hypothetical protein [Caudoviricetes sp.]
MAYENERWDRKTRTYLHFVLIVDAKTINLTSRKDD